MAFVSVWAGALVLSVLAATGCADATAADDDFDDHAAAQTSGAVTEVFDVYKGLAGTAATASDPRIRLTARTRAGARARDRSAVEVSIAKCTDEATCAPLCTNSLPLAELVETYVWTAIERAKEQRAELEAERRAGHIGEEEFRRVGVYEDPGAAPNTVLVFALALDNPRRSRGEMSHATPLKVDVFARQLRDGLVASGLRCNAPLSVP